MIVDCHTRIHDLGAQVSRAAFTPPATLEGVHAEAARHMASCTPVDRSIVLGFRSRYLEREIPNRFVAEYVRKYSSRLVGFAGLDPTDPDWRSELKVAQEELRLKGVTIAPSLQDYHPCDTRAMRLYEECSRRGMPVLVQHNSLSAASKLEYARPYLFDEVCRSFPSLRIVMAHLGYPWVDETIVLLGKHANILAEVSGVVDQRWTAYNALLTAYQYGVADKLLFGSDYPFRSPAACIEALYSINQISHGTSLPPIPRESLRGIVERDALKLLGISNGTDGNAGVARSPVADED